MDVDPSRPDAVMRFIRESQIAAGTLIPPVDPIAVARAIHCTFVAAPECFAVYPTVEMAKVLLAFAERVIGREDLWLSDAQSKSGRERRAADAIRLIVARHSQPSLALRDIAHELHVSAPYLSEVLTRTSGYGFLTHLQAVRVLGALTLISRTDHSIGRVGSKIGYRHEFQLARHFFARVGVRPARFRRVIDG